jgi:hypothetical protein
MELLRFVGPRERVFDLLNWSFDLDPLVAQPLGIATLSCQASIPTYAAGIQVEDPGLFVKIGVAKVGPDLKLRGQVTKSVILATQR